MCLNNYKIYIYIELPSVPFIKGEYLVSNFSEKIKFHIEKSEVKIYQLAKKSGLDRTTIQRTITGERLPSLNFIEKLADYLRLSHSERSELFNLYSISKIGEKVYAGRKYIKEMIEGIATIHSAGEDTVSIQKSILYTGKINKDIAIYEGQYLINNMLKDVLEDEVANNLFPEINISVPFNCSFLFDLLYQLYLVENGRINIKNITRFNKIHAYQDSNYNLKILSHVMPIAFSAGNGYQLYYYYDNFDCSNDIAVLMPYYIITHNRLITLSSDYNTAILYNNEGIINIYKRKFHDAINKSVPLITQHYTCNDMLEVYIDSVKNSGLISHVIEPQPCFAWYYTDDLINSHLRPEIDNREMLLELLCNYYENVKNCTRPMSIFSIEGLKTFAITGILSDLPTQFAIPFTVEERIMLLDKLRSDILLDKYQVYAVNSSNWIIPFSTIQLNTTKGITFFTTNNNGIISSAFMEENSIAEAFYDFFESLLESDLIYGKDETIKIIDSIMLVLI